MPAHFENDENMTVAKFELVFTRCRNNLKTVKLDAKDLDAKEMYLHLKNRSVAFQKRRYFFLFSSFTSVHRISFPKRAG